MRSTSGIDAAWLLKTPMNEPNVRSLDKKALSLASHTTDGQTNQEHTMGKHWPNSTAEPAHRVPGGAPPPAL